MGVSVFCLVVMFAASVSAGVCTNNVNTIIRLSGNNNAHAAVWNDTVYDWEVCAGQVFGAAFAPYPGDTHACTGSNRVLSLDTSSNSHAAFSGNPAGSYPIDVCFADLVCSVDTTAGPDCTNGGAVVVRLYNNVSDGPTSLYNAHVSSAGQTVYPSKICCTSVFANVPDITSPPAYRWEDMNGVVISSDPSTPANVRDTVRMVVSSPPGGPYADGDPIDFDVLIERRSVTYGPKPTSIRRGGGGGGARCPRPCQRRRARAMRTGFITYKGVTYTYNPDYVFRLDFSYKNLYVNPLSGNYVSADNEAVSFWTISDAAYNAMLVRTLRDAKFELTDHLGQSDKLWIGGDTTDLPLNVTILNPRCGEYYFQGEVVPIRVELDDVDDPIFGGLIIYEGSGSETSYNLTNGITEINYTFTTAGNAQVVLEAYNGYFSGSSFIVKEQVRKTSSVMIIDNSTIGNYIAACISKPADYSRIDSSTVDFDASTTKAIRYNPSATPMIENLTLADLNFFWRFSDGGDKFSYRRC